MAPSAKCQTVPGDTSPRSLWLPCPDSPACQVIVRAATSGPLAMTRVANSADVSPPCADASATATRRAPSGIVCVASRPSAVCQCVTAASGVSPSLSTLTRVLKKPVAPSAK